MSAVQPTCYQISVECDRLRDRLTFLEHAWAVQRDEIGQTLGKALDFPAFYPLVSDVDDGSVCTGDHVTETLASAAAARIAELDARPAVCVAVVVEDAAGRVLLLKRSESGTWPGTWCLPGGRLDPGETLEDCCRRELAEETGLRVRRLVFECLTECFGPPHLIGVVFRAVGGVSEVPRNAEPEKHDAIGWFAPDAMPSPLMPGVVQWLEQRRGPGPVAERYADGDSVRAPEEEL